MKIGILTFWNSPDNYGQILQCYALQKHLRNQGHDAYLIRYAPKAIGIRAKLRRALSPSVLWTYLKSRKAANASATFQCKHSRHFPEFLANHVKMSAAIYHSLSELKNDAPEANAYIVGSDQVWNPSIGLNDFGKAWFLEFGNSCTKRISYAASFGMATMRNDYCSFFAPSLKKFDAVGVRESEGIDFCRQMGRADAAHVCDPTLLLNKKSYCELIPEHAPSSSTQRRSLVCYMLGHSCAFPQKALDAFVKKNDLDFHYVPSQGAEKLEYYLRFETPSVHGWLGLYRDAEYIVTNSFHGTVFAIIMHKKFIALPLAGNAGKMNGRLECLLKNLGLEKHLFSGDAEHFFDLLQQEIDWADVEARRTLLREQATAFLKNALA